MNSFIKISCIIFSFSIVAVDARTGPHIVTGTISKPNTSYQVPFKAWYDPKNYRSRIDYFGSEIKTYQLPIGETQTMMYKTNPASDISTKWTVCHRYRKSSTFYQPAIPILMPLENSESTTLHGTPCTKYWVNTGSTLLEYYVREENSIKIPMLYIQYINPPSYKISHYIYYHEYTPAFDISDKVFIVDPEVAAQCFETNKNRQVDPMIQFISPIDIYDKKLKRHNNIYEKLHSNTHTEAKLRQDIFRQNLKLIEAVNREQRGYRLGINKFKDQTDEELAELSCDENKIGDIQFNTTFINKNVALPEELDYRKEGFETRVKNQHKCECCYVFGAVAAAEGAYFKKTGNSISLSEQSLLECATWTMYMAGGGCYGGMGEWVLEKVQKLGGIPAEHDYREFMGMERLCQWKNDVLVVQIKEVIHVPKYDITELKKALVTYGPVKVSIQLSKQFYLYIDGVFDDPECSNHTLTHAMMLIGYGVEWGKPYWLFKNSWGPDFGDRGYIKISQRNNRCGVLNNPYYVVLK